MEREYSADTVRGCCFTGASDVFVRGLFKFGEKKHTYLFTSVTTRVDEFWEQGVYASRRGGGGSGRGKFQEKSSVNERREGVFLSERTPTPPRKKKRKKGQLILALFRAWCLVSTTFFIISSVPN